MNRYVHKQTSTTAETATKLAVEIISLMDGLPSGDAMLVLDQVEHFIRRQLHDIPVKKIANVNQRLLRVGLIEEQT